ncbi:UNVERIFIED_CONTAM: hypothetical protein Q9R58_21150 [Methylobacteriaceae bacterium AG10]|jgi:hypothetical protein|uniref:hypothetical protein n=2 Tax=Methylorubrum populi TaxID=223967 RepID=UPI000DB61062|nr:hypothetical protein [Methylorubrum populi]MDV2986831.1 hypothetical protein [Methylobacteriaceae bacterium AG10]PZP65518.1 MAG: hypothetical protein DI590_26850 [Methylorubrum populi]
MAGASALEALATGLNERQRAYLVAAYDEDQAREVTHRGPGGPPARTWRWIEYGPVGAKWLDGPGSRLLRAKLAESGLVSQGTGATWASLVERGLLTTKYEHTGLIDTRSHRAIQSLLVRLTTDGRKVARILRGESPTRPRSKEPKALSLSALRLIAYGQQHPEETFDFHAPWGVCPLDYLMILGVCRGLVKRGLLTGDPPTRLRITPAGEAIDVTREPTWKPLAQTPTPFRSFDTL